MPRRKKFDIEIERMLKDLLTKNIEAKYWETLKFLDQLAKEDKRLKKTALF